MQLKDLQQEQQDYTFHQQKTSRFQVSLRGSEPLLRCNRRSGRALLDRSIAVGAKAECDVQVGGERGRCGGETCWGRSPPQKGTDHVGVTTICCRPQVECGGQWILRKDRINDSP